MKVKESHRDELGQIFNHPGKFLFIFFINIFHFFIMTSVVKEKAPIKNTEIQLKKLKIEK